MFLNLKDNNFIPKSIEWIFYAFIGLFPFIFYEGFIFYGTTSRAVNLVILAEIAVLILCFFLFKKNINFHIAKSPVTVALSLFLGVYFISAVYGVDFASSFWSKATRMTGIFYFLHLGMFYMFLLMIFNIEDKLRKFLSSFLWGAGIFSLGVLLSNDGFGIIFTTEKWTGFTFGNSSFAAMYLFAAFLVSIYFVLLKEKKRWWNYLAPVVFIINPYFININLWSGGVNIFKNPLGIIGEAQASSAAMLVSVALLLFAWVVSQIKRDDVKRNILWASVILGIVGLVGASLSLLSTEGYLRNAYLKQASNARPIVWELSKNSIADRPLLGWGGDNFDRSFEKNYDNSILEQRNGAEPWFDRAHNIFIDQTVETGYIGLATYLLVYVSIFSSLVYVVLRSKEKRHQQLAVILMVYFVGHIMELQTAFDTTISYVAVIIMIALTSTIFYKTYQAEVGEKSLLEAPKAIQYITGGVLLSLFGYLFFAGTVPIVKSNYTNGSIRTAGSSEKRLPMYPALFSSPVDKATFLWKTTNDFQRGVAQKPEIIEDPKKRAGLISEIAVYTEEYRKYANEHPDDYRVRFSLAGAYIYERLFEVDHLDEAHKVLDDAIKLYPQIPQAYWMKSVAYLYQRKFDLAREWAKKSYDLNPNIEQSQRIVDYIERSIKSFPNIDLYTFGQI